MQIGILHISDIHIDKADDWILDKGKQIALATAASVFDISPDAFFIVVSGDIANKGTAEQYEIARAFLEEIGTHLVTETNVPTYFVLAPGNHDCDFHNPTRGPLRTLAINAVIENPNIAENGSEILERCLEVQENFFSFTRNVATDLNYPDKPEVYYQLRIPISDQTVVFNCFNTAWLTEMEETQGHLIIPPWISETPALYGHDGSLSFAIYHHPDNWLSADNANHFRPLVEKISDIVMAGHEHFHELYTKQNIELGGEVLVLRAGALQERSAPETSEFTVSIVDLPGNRLRAHRLHWDTSQYKAVKETDWVPFHRNKQLLHGRYELTKEFRDWVTRLDGTPIMHARRPTLRVDDLYVKPRAHLISLERIVDGKPARELIESDKFEAFIWEKEKVVVYGETLQGKTTTAKYLFAKLYSQGVIPVFVSGFDLVSRSIDDVLKIVKRQFEQQYQNEKWTEFLTDKEKAKRAIIIDDFGRGAYLQSQLQEILRILADRFELVIAFAHSDLLLAQYVENEKGKVRITKFSHCELRPLNRHERSMLIRKWIFLGAGTTPENELALQVGQKKQVVETAVEAALMPAFPPFVMAAMQLSETYTAEVDKRNYGTIGYLYEGLITSRFQALGDPDLDLLRLNLLLARMAYHCFSSGNAQSISPGDTTSILQQYRKEYGVEVYQPRFLEQIIEAGIVTKENGHLKFASTQMRDFYVAEYFAERLHEENDDAKGGALGEIEKIIRTLSYETHTRILLFLVFKASDRMKFIRLVLAEARKIFVEFSPAQFTDDVQFLNDLSEESTDPLKLEAGTIWERQEDYEKRADELEEQQPPDDYQSADRYMVEYRDDLQHFIKSAIALKMIEILGQLVRSFSSTLKRDVKIELLVECMELGLRFLESLYKIREEDIKDVRAILSRLIKDKHSTLSLAELVERADEILLFLFHGVTFGVIKKVVMCSGHEDLKDIYADIFNKTDLPLNYQVMFAAYKLEHYADPDLPKIASLAEGVKDSNNFVWNVIRRLVVISLNYSRSIKGAERDEIMHRLDLQDSAAFLLNDEKGERKYLPTRPKKFLPPKEPVKRTK